MTFLARSRKTKRGLQWQIEHIPAKNSISLLLVSIPITVSVVVDDDVHRHVARDGY